MTSTGRGAVHLIGAPPSEAPHLPQNFTPGIWLAPQREQRRVLPGSEPEPGEGSTSLAASFAPALISEVTGRKVVLPHRPQNFAVAAKREPHFVQATTPGVLDGAPETLPRLPPCEGESPLDGAVLNCACMICSSASGRTSITRSSSSTPGRATRSLCCPGGIELRMMRPDRPMLPCRSSST